MRRFSLGALAYLATIAVAYLSPIAMLATHALLAIYYCFDQLAPARQGSATARD